MKSLNLVMLTCLMLGANSSQASLVGDMMNEFKQQGVETANPAAGATFWQKEFVDQKSGDVRACKSCHGTDLRKSGKHVRTEKVIKPMAVSVNTDRLTDRKKVNKWFKRNCKWTLGRECTAQEKADVMVYISKE